MGEFEIGMGELREKAMLGEALGNLDDVLYRLERGISDLPMSTSRLVR